MFLFKRKEEVQQQQFTLIENQPKGTDSIVLIEDIFVPQEFKKHPPSDKKKDRCKSMYYKLGYLDKPITVIADINEHGRKNELTLVDGYSRYLFAKYYLKMEQLPVKYISYEEYFDMKSKHDAEYIKWNGNNVTDKEKC